MFKLDNLGIIIEAPSTEYPYGRLINSNPSGSGNGSPAIAEWANDPLMGMIAALDHFGLIPSDLQEQVGDSDFVRLMQAVFPVGSFLQFAIDTDPTTLDIRALVSDGSTVSEVTYADLFARIGNTWDTGGEPVGEFRLPDLRGKFLRGFDNGAGVDIGRVFAAAQLDAMQTVTGDMGGDIALTILSGAPVGAFVSSAGGAANAPNLGTTGKIQNITFNNANSSFPNAAKTNDIETRVINETCNILIRY